MGARTAPPSVEVDSSKAVIRALADVVSLVEPRLLDLWRTTGITFAQRRLLRRLRDGSRSPGALAAELGISAPTLTRHLQRLENHHLLSRSVDSEDRRRVVVELTDAGRRSLADHRIFGGSPLAHAAAGLSPSERRALVEALGHLTSVAKTRAESLADE
ncbi:MAG TPA: MarR family winged helix-turn-helix transcriptional regulator [Candidatus Dormibacteraeota bacterium]|nr:MarR family winged helix-turn-helix transcriptional regulator [Candidatus Dormibacteraeota bacterium]